MHLKILALLIPLVLAPAIQAEETASEDHDAMHMMHHGDDAPAPMPEEGGQAAFAAMAEITQILIDDPDTDWSKVNIDALRAHLVDMENVTLHAKAETLSQGESILFLVRGEGAVAASIERMVLAHAPMLAEATGWQVEARASEDGAELGIVAQQNERQKIRSLGFFGVMTIGAHHQIHHEMIARGADPHDH